MSEPVMIKSYKTSEAQRRAYKKWWEEHKEECRKLNRKYGKDHPDKTRERVRKFRERQRAIKTGFQELGAINCF